MRVPTRGALLGLRFRPKVLWEEDVPSETYAGVWYTVRLFSDGSADCSCPDYLIRRRPLDEECKHIPGVRGRAGLERKASLCP